MKLQKFLCHKTVHAAKITEICNIPTGEGQEDSGARSLIFGDIESGTVVEAKFMEKHKPEVGGYFVQYEDGYTSFSPAKAFEDGYSLVTE